MITATKWKIEFTQTADKQLEKLDRQVCHAINRYLYERLATDKDPKRFGRALLGNMKTLWRYRIGDYRLICEIRKDKLLILVIRIAHRKEVYE